MFAAMREAKEFFEDQAQRVKAIKEKTAAEIARPSWGESECTRWAYGRSARKKE
jgi:hypothetical protein